jgi:hypothetical protein
VAVPFDNFRFRLLPQIRLRKASAVLSLKTVDRSRTAPIRSNAELRS